MNRPFYFFIQPTYWFGQQALTWFSSGGVILWHTLCKVMRKDHLNSDFSEDAGTGCTSLYCMYLLMSTNKTSLFIVLFDVLYLFPHCPPLGMHRAIVGDLTLNLFPTLVYLTI